MLTDELDALETQRIVDALAAHGGNQLPRTFVERLAQYRIQRPRRWLDGGLRGISEFGKVVRAQRRS